MYIKWSFPLRISSVNVVAFLVAFTEETINAKLYFLCSVIKNVWSHIRRNYRGWLISFFREKIKKDVWNSNYTYNVLGLHFHEFYIRKWQNAIPLKYIYYIRKSHEHVISGKPDELYYICLYHGTFMLS